MKFLLTLVLTIYGYANHRVLAVDGLAFKSRVTIGQWQNALPPIIQKALPSPGLERFHRLKQSLNPIPHFYFNIEHRASCILAFIEMRTLVFKSFFPRPFEFFSFFQV
jgi:hypothetical protein